MPCCWHFYCTWQGTGMFYYCNYYCFLLYRIPRMLEVMMGVGLSLPRVVSALCTFFYRFCRMFGKTFTYKKVRSVLKHHQLHSFNPKYPKWFFSLSLFTCTWSWLWCKIQHKENQISSLFMSACLSAGQCWNLRNFIYNNSNQPSIYSFTCFVILHPMFFFNIIKYTIFEKYFLIGEINEDFWKTYYLSFV